MMHLLRHPNLYSSMLHCQVWSTVHTEARLIVRLKLPDVAVAADAAGMAANMAAAAIDESASFLI